MTKECLNENGSKIFRYRKENSSDLFDVHLRVQRLPICDTVSREITDEFVSRGGDQNENMKSWLKTCIVSGKGDKKQKLRY